MFRKILFSLILCLTCFAGPLKPPKGMVLNQGRVKGLIGLWLMPEGSGNKVFDLSGNGNTGTFDAARSPVWTSGKYGPALLFTSDRIIVSDAPFDLDTAFTIIAGINRTDTGGFEVVVSKRDGSSFAYEFRISDTDKLQLLTSGGATPSGATNVPSGEPAQIGCTFDNGTAILYLNGAQDGSGGGKTITNNAVNLTIGVRAVDSSFYSGLIDYVYIYNRVLTASEMKRRYISPFYEFQPEPPMTYMGSVSAAAPAGQVIMIQMSAIPLVLIIGCVLIFSKGKKAT